MTRLQFDHVLRAAGAITQEEVMVVIGSQAILAFDPTPPSELVVSVEVDLFPLQAPEKADLIDGSIGEKSLLRAGYTTLDAMNSLVPELDTKWQNLISERLQHPRIST